MDRPKKGDFIARKGQAFKARFDDRAETLHWHLTDIQTLASPDFDGLRELECFVLIFKHKEPETLPQGTYHLTCDDGFKVTLFATPSLFDEMTVSIN